MIRCSCHGLHGCAPVAPSVKPSPSASSRSCERRFGISAAASANVSQRPVRTSTSEAISSPTRCSSSSVPAAAAWTELVAVAEGERGRLEDRKLLLDREREVPPGLESLARERNLLLGSELLLVTH